MAETLCRFASVLFLALFAAAADSSGSFRGARNSGDQLNMNGDYVLSSTPGANNTKLFPTSYKDYPDKETISFDVYSPMVSHLYSQVFWKGLPPVALPDFILERFQDKVMAVVGFELDQVAEDENGQEFSVPINAAYNHHFESTMIGGNSARFELISPNDPRLVDKKSSMGHGIPPNQPYWLVVDGDDEVTADGKQQENNAAPTQQAFGGANGGEVRQSFHGYAPGFAQLIENPRQIQITPMQIDTWHRDLMSLQNTTQFVAGPLPRNSLAPPNAPYSGLLECPVSTRLIKRLPPQGFFPLSQGKCDHQVANEEECFHAAAELVRESDTASQIQNVAGKSYQRPTGCSVRVLTVKEGHQMLEAYYNTNEEANTDCASPDANVFSATATISLVTVHVIMDEEQDLVTISVTGPADVWFGIGFGAQLMSDEPWTIVVEGAAATERKLQNHAGGRVISPPTIQVVSNTVNTDTNTRTVIVTRSLSEQQYFAFDTRNARINFINAIGSSEEFAYHEKKEATSMLILPVASSSDSTNGGGICLCQQDSPPFGQDTGGYMEYKPVKGQPGERGETGRVPVNNQCLPYPRMDLLEQKNPTCDIRTYTGGQMACHNMWSLLDADQDIPWPNQPLEYRLKFRFWVQDYDADYHTHVRRTTWGIGSPVEYDVPKCSADVPGCSQQLDPTTGKQRWVHTIRGKFQVEDAVNKLVAAHFHCHAPMCLRTALYKCPSNLDENDVCDETNGILLCEETAVQKQGQAGERFNEPGFIYQPPCLWGSPNVGLEPPVDVRNATLFAMKTADASYGHHGEMAWLQVYYI